MITTEAKRPVRAELACALCRGHFAGQGYSRRGRVYCCDVCAERDSGAGWTTLLLAAASLVGLGAYLRGR